MTSKGFPKGLGSWPLRMFVKVPTFGLEERTTLLNAHLADKICRGEQTELFYIDLGYSAEYHGQELLSFEDGETCYIHESSLYYPSHMDSFFAVRKKYGIKSIPID